MDGRRTTHRRGGLGAGLFRRFLADRRGGLYTVAAVIALPLIGFLGIAADASHAYLVKARLSTSVDAAALAGGRVAFTPAYGEAVTQYFKSNFPDGYLGATVTGPTFTTTKAADGSTVVKVAATATVPTAFMHLFGFDTMTVSAESEVTRKNTAMDVVLSIDMSGSMASYSGGEQKIDAARDAAKSLVDILYGADETNPNLNIGLVPWNGNVNVMLDTSTANPLSLWQPHKTRRTLVGNFSHPVTGKTQNNVWRVNNSPVLLLDKPDTDWKGCVYARYTDDANTANDADDVLGYVDAYGWKRWEPRHGGNTCQNCTPCLLHGITPLNQSKAAILTSIDRLKQPTGNTDLPQGLSWAWRVLMNTDPFTEATADDPDKQLIRAIVLLTDGANCAATGDGYKAVWGGCYWYSTQKMNERALAVADNIKKQGVLIYTIQFGFDDPDSAAPLKKTASTAGSPCYNDAPDAATLQTVFQQIGTSLSDLRISK
jgi:Flp pilus assembly protein TadG